MIDRMVIEPLGFHGHETMNEALAAAEAARLARIQDIDSLRGQSISCYEYSGDQLVMQLSSKNWLTIGADEKGVWWRVEANRQSMRKMPLPIELTLIFRSADTAESLTYLWEWKGLLDSIIDRAITVIQPVDGLFYLSFGPDIEIAFNSNRVVDDTGGFLLFFCPDD